MLITAIRAPNGNPNNLELTILKPVTPPSDTLFGINTASNPYAVINAPIIIIKAFEAIFSLLGLFLIIFSM